MKSAARALYADCGTDDQLAAFGLTRDDVTPAVIQLSPEEADSVDLFIALQTQWNVGPGGPVGINYASIPCVMDLQGIPAGDRRTLFDDLRVMEREALKEMNDG